MTGSFDTLGSGNDRSYGGSNRSDEGDETEIIAADIRVTQERLGNTIEEIGERFNPTRLKEELKHDIRDATIGKVENMAQQTAEMVSDAQRSIMQTIRENPVPFVIAGVGIGWMLLNATSKQNRKTSSAQYDGEQRGWDRPYGTGQENFYDEQEAGTMDRVRSKASDVVDSVKERTSSLADQTRETMHRVGDRAHDMTDRVANETRTMSRRVQGTFQDNPLVIGAAALALGLAAGLTIPATEKEAELVGDTRDQLVDKVKHAAEDTKTKVEQVAERVMDQAETTAKDAAHEVGLVS
jgi:gas vesicle protein